MKLRARTETSSRSRIDRNSDTVQILNFSSSGAHFEPGALVQLAPENWITVPSSPLETERILGGPRHRCA